MGELMARLAMEVRPVPAEPDVKEEENLLDGFLSRVQRTCHELTLRLDSAETGLMVGFLFLRFCGLDDAGKLCAAEDVVQRR